MLEPADACLAAHWHVVVNIIPGNGCRPDSSKPILLARLAAIGMSAKCPQHANSLEGIIKMGALIQQTFLLCKIRVAVAQENGM